MKSYLARDYPVTISSSCYAEGLTMHTFWTSEFLNFFVTYKNKTRRKSEGQKTCCCFYLMESDYFKWQKCYAKNESENNLVKKIKQTNAPPPRWMCFWHLCFSSSFTYKSDTDPLTANLLCFHATSFMSID